MLRKLFVLLNPLAMAFFAGLLWSKAEYIPSVWIGLFAYLILRRILISRNISSVEMPLLSIGERGRVSAFWRRPYVSESQIAQGAKADGDDLVVLVEKLDREGLSTGIEVALSAAEHFIDRNEAIRANRLGYVYMSDLGAVAVEKDFNPEQVVETEAPRLTQG